MCKHSNRNIVRIKTLNRIEQNGKLCPRMTFWFCFFHLLHENRFLTAIIKHLTPQKPPTRNETSHKTKRFRCQQELLTKKRLASNQLKCLSKTAKRPGFLNTTQPWRVRALLNKPLACFRQLWLGQRVGLAGKNGCS